MTESVNMIKYHSWDAANKTIAFIDASIMSKEEIVRGLAEYAAMVDVEIENLKKLVVNMSTGGGVPTGEDLSGVRAVVIKLKHWMDSLVSIRTAVVHDLLTGRLVKSVSQRERAAMLKKYVGGVDGIPGIAIVEHQGSRIGGATPTFNLAVAHQLCYHYADTPAEFVSINSSRKNRICFAPHLTLEAVAEHHGRKIRKNPADFSPDQKKAARKLHTTENMKWFCRVWGINALDGVKPALINHIADAFMQMMAYHFQ